MHNAVEIGVFLAWFTARAAFAGIAYLMARGKGRNPFGWTLAAAFAGLIAVIVLSFLKEAAPAGAARLGMHSLRTAPARRRRGFRE